MALPASSALPPADGQDHAYTSPASPGRRLAARFRSPARRGLEKCCIPGRLHASASSRGSIPARLQVRDDQGAAAKLPRQLAHLAECARAENDAGGRGKFKSHKRARGTGRASPGRIFRKEVRELHAAAGLGHHGRHRIPPGLVMFRLLVRGGRLQRSIGLHEHEARRVILLLDTIEAGDARLLDAFPQRWR